MILFNFLFLLSRLSELLLDSEFVVPLGFVGALRFPTFGRILSATRVLLSLAIPRLMRFIGGTIRRISIIKSCGRDTIM